MAHCS